MKSKSICYFSLTFAITRTSLILTMTGKITHKAAFLPAKGSDLVLGERETSSPGPGEVLIRNHVIAVNPVDWKRQAWGFMISSYPAILGAGTIPPSSQ